MKAIRIIAGLALLFTSLLAHATPIRYSLTGHIDYVNGNLTNFKIGDSFSGWLQFDWDVIYNTPYQIDWRGDEEYQNALSYHFTFADYIISSNINVLTSLDPNRPKIFDGSYTPMDAYDLAPRTSRPNTFIDELMLSSSGFYFYYWESNAIYLNETRVGGSIDSVKEGYTAVPEPPSSALLLLGLIGIYLFRKKAFFLRKQQ